MSARVELDRWTLPETPDTFSLNARALPSTLFDLLNPIAGDASACAQSSSTSSPAQTPLVDAFSIKKGIREPSLLLLDDQPWEPLEYDSLTRSKAGGNRKVSHSVIEKRRRERINHCLIKLQNVVPKLRTEARLKTQKKGPTSPNLRRTRAKQSYDDSTEDDDVEKQSVILSKLEILQGALQRIEELEARVQDLQQDRHGTRSSSTGSLHETDAAKILTDLASPHIVPADHVL